MVNPLPRSSSGPQRPRPSRGAGGAARRVPLLRSPGNAEARIVDPEPRRSAETAGGSGTVRPGGPGTAWPFLSQSITIDSNPFVCCLSRDQPALVFRRVALTLCRQVFFLADAERHCAKRAFVPIGGRPQQVSDLVGTTRAFEVIANRTRGVSCVFLGHLGYSCPVSCFGTVGANPVCVLEKRLYVQPKTRIYDPPGLPPMHDQPFLPRGGTMPNSTPSSKPLNPGDE